MPPYSFSSMAGDDDPAAYPGLELLATAVLLLTEALEVSYANPAAENLFELSRRQLLGHSIRTVFGEAPALFQVQVEFPDGDLARFQSPDQIRMVCLALEQ